MSEVTAIGIDAGSTTAKAVAVDAGGTMVAWDLEPMSPRVAVQTEQMVAALRERVGAGDVPVYATGYGRKLVPGATRAITEITCHAMGAFTATGSTGTLVDIGGQDSKVIRIGPGGMPVDFAMNDKCAAGTGRFLEHTASRLGVALDDIGPQALSAPTPQAITSTCTVFAESEIISLVANGAEVPAILAGLHRGLVTRVMSMVRTVGLTTPLLLSGGVARNPAMVAYLERESGEKVILPADPQLMGAYGAALLASRARNGAQTDDPAGGGVPEVAAGPPCEACGDPDAVLPAGPPGRSFLGGVLGRGRNRRRSS